jgi:hypothetical protein
MRTVVLLCLAFNVAFISGCGPLRGSVALPNGYSLKMTEKRQPFLIDPSGKHILPASQFMVSGSYVYGWIDNKDNLFFFLNTETGDLYKDLSWEALDALTQRHEAKKFSMSESLTFWDMVSGAKKATW